MKALTFLQAWKAPVSHIYSIHKYYDVVSFEFKPEMIETYFDGWTRELPSQIDYVKLSLNYEHRIIDFSNTSDRSLLYCRTPLNINNPNKVKERFVVPKTINEFISDCSRAGIELTWKEEIIKKYFN